MEIPGETLSRRNPNPNPTSSDTVFYSIFPDDLSLSSSSLHSLLLHLHSLLSPLTSPYIWQHDPFLLSPSSSLSPCLLCNSPPLPHLHGKTRFGDNLEDEWFVVFLLFQISLSLPSLSLRTWDSDGEFLLIESAFSLPPWLDPSTSPNRIFIRNNHLHIIPLHISPSSPSLLFSLQTLKTREADTKASDSIQEVLKKRLLGYPERARANTQRVLVYVPIQVAQVLRCEPRMISLAVEGFYDRDVDSMKDAARMEVFLGREMVRVSVEMSRAMYAQLVLQRFRAPDCYSMSQERDWKEAEIGMKIACGFEMMYQGRRREGREGKGSGWEAFRGSLEMSGCFDGVVEGSKEYKRVVDNALEYYRSCSLFEKTRYGMFHQ